MGLDFSHCDAHWSYGGFDHFRVKLASEIKMNLDDMEGFGGSTPFNSFKDPILPLIDHSDCDGELTVEECKQVAPRLRELVKDWKDGNYDRNCALELAEGMENAIKANENLKFM